MLTKKPKSQLLKNVKKAGIFLVLAEGAALLSSYFVWHRMNTSQGCRTSALGNKRRNCLNELLCFMAYIQSAVWLAGCSALGYLLLKVTTSNESELEQLLLKRQSAQRPIQGIQDSAVPKVPVTANPFYAVVKKDQTADSKEAVDNNKNRK